MLKSTRIIGFQVILDNARVQLNCAVAFVNVEDRKLKGGGKVEGLLRAGALVGASALYRPGHITYEYQGQVSHLGSQVLTCISPDNSFAREPP